MSMRMIHEGEGKWIIQEKGKITRLAKFWKRQERVEREQSGAVSHSDKRKDTLTYGGVRGQVEGESSVC